MWIVAGLTALILFVVRRKPLPALVRRFRAGRGLDPDRLHAGRAVATPIAGRLGDRFGYRRVLLACLACLACAAIAAAGLLASFAVPG